MGNCLACFKEPDSSAALNSSPSCGKEEMPEAQLYPAPSHVPASSAPLTDAHLISNGNHLSAISDPQLASQQQPIQQPRFFATHQSAQQQQGGAPPLSHHHHQSQQRKGQSRSAPVMGLAESRMSDVKLNALFDSYKDLGEEVMLADGIEKLCKDLQVNPADFKVLVMAWKMNAEQMCRFTRAEFVGGLKVMKAESLKGIQARLPEIVHEVDEDLEQFKDLYRFTFRFGLDSAAGQRILPTEMAVVLWRLVFTVREPPILGRWLAFLESHPHSVRGIPRDTWNMFLNFAEAVGDDLSCYDDNEAWPSLFDDFVEYENDQANQNVVIKEAKIDRD